MLYSTPRVNREVQRVEEEISMPHIRPFLLHIAGRVPVRSAASGRVFEFIGAGGAAAIAKARVTPCGIKLRFRNEAVSTPFANRH